MLKLKKYEGCGCCEKCRADFNCNAHTIPVTIIFKNSAKWDNCGHMVTVFRKGEKVKGYAVVDDNNVFCASAESTIYSGVADFIDLDCVEIEL